MQIVLVDRRELVPQDLVEMLEHLRVAFHLSPLRQHLASPWQRGSLSRAAYHEYACRPSRIAPGIRAADRHERPIPPHRHALPPPHHPRSPCQGNPTPPPPPPHRAPHDHIFPWRLPI